MDDQTAAHDGFDQHTINHATVAVGREMVPLGCAPHPETDTLFMGGAVPSENELRSLSRFACSKNYKVVWVSHDPAQPDAGPARVDVLVNDGLEDEIILSDGRLWKRDRSSASVIVFPGFAGVVKLSTKGRLLIRERPRVVHAHGYDIACEAVLARAARRPGRVPVVAPVGTLMTVLDMPAFTRTFAMAA